MSRRHAAEAQAVYKMKSNLAKTANDANYITPDESL